MTDKPSLHIVTVGTSVLKRGQGAPLPDADAVLKRMGKDHAQARKDSAELNSLLPVLKPGDRVHLLGTNSEDGQLAAGIIGRWIRQHTQADHQQGAKLELIARELNTARNPKDFYRAACEFRDALFRVAGAAIDRGESVLVHATGGLKPQVALAVLVAAELGLRCVYIHEDMTEPVTLPVNRVESRLLAALARVEKAGFGRNSVKAAGQDLDELERQCLIYVQRNPQGDEVTSVKLSDFGKHLLQNRDGR